MTVLGSVPRLRLWRSRRSQRIVVQAVFAAGVALLLIYIASRANRLDLDFDFMQAVLAQVGNYGEVYARTLEPIGLTRAGSLNALWTEGGLIYGPPGR